MIGFITIDGLIILVSLIIFHASEFIIDDKVEFIIGAISGIIFILSMIALLIVVLLNNFGLIS